MHWVCIRIIAACWILFSGAYSVSAADYPTRPVTFTIAFAPGGGTDILARMVAKKLTDTWGQTVIVENRPGADGTIAAELISRAAADGYSVLWTTNDYTFTPSIQQLSYDPINSLTPVIQGASAPDVFLVNASSPAKSFQDFIAYAKSKPGQLNYGTSGPGTSQYLETQMLMKDTGISMVNVSYKGSAPALIALLGNEIDQMFGSISGSLSQVKAGKLRALAVSSKTRSAILPDVPTIAEAASIPDFEGGPWYGVMVPGGTPHDIVGKLNRDIAAAIHSPEILQTLSDQGFVVAPNSPAQFSALVKHEMDKWAAVIKSLDTKPQ